MTSYLAADDYGMDRRTRRLHRFLVSSPVVLLIAISAVGHLRKPAHIGAAGNAEYDRNVLAYRDRVASVGRLTYGHGRQPIATLGGEAQKWTEGYRTGELRPLIPAAYEDHLRDGVRGEVLTAGLLLTSHLASRAKDALAQGSYDEAASTSVLAAETAFGMRRFELEAFLQCVHSARRPLETLEKAWPHLSADKRQALQPRLKAMRIDPSEPKSLLDLDNSLVDDYVARQGIPSTMPKPGSPAFARASVERGRAAEKSTRVHNALIASFVGSSES